MDTIHSHQLSRHFNWVSDRYTVAPFPFYLLLSSITDCFRLFNHWRAVRHVSIVEVSFLLVLKSHSGSSCLPLVLYPHKTLARWFMPALWIKRSSCSSTCERWKQPDELIPRRKRNSKAWNKFMTTINQIRKMESAPEDDARKDMHHLAIHTEDSIFYSFLWKSYPSQVILLTDQWNAAVNRRWWATVLLAKLLKNIVTRLIHFPVWPFPFIQVPESAARVATSLRNSSACSGRVK